MRSLVPFGVVGSTSVHNDLDGTPFRCREYPWGVVNIEDQVKRTSKMLGEFLFAPEPMRLCTPETSITGYAHARFERGHPCQTLRSLPKNEAQRNDGQGGNYSMRPFHNIYKNIQTLEFIAKESG